MIEQRRLALVAELAPEVIAKCGDADAPLTT